MNKGKRESCINTIKMLERLAINVNGMIDVVDAANCDAVIAWLRKTGQWIADGEHDAGNGLAWDEMHCSVCGRKDIDEEKRRTPYCPWCGAKMEENV